MLFYVILTLILIASIVGVFAFKDKNGTDKKAKKVKKMCLCVAAFTFLAIFSLSISVIRSQADTTEESLEMERVYLIYKVEHNEYDSSIVRRIEDYNKGIQKAQKYLGNPFVGIFYTKAEAEAEPIYYEIKIVDKAESGVEGDVVPTDKIILNSVFDGDSNT